MSLNPGQWGGRACVWDGEQPKFYNIKEVRPCPSDKLSEQIETFNEDAEQAREQLENFILEGKQEIDEALKTETQTKEEGDTTQNNGEPDGKQQVDGDA